MSLLLEKLENWEEHSQGGWQGRCPACEEMDKDTAGDNLRIWPDEQGNPGPYRCAAFMQSIDSEEHSKRIYALAGKRKKGPSRPRIPSAEELKAKALEKEIAEAVKAGSMARSEARAFSWDWKAESGKLPGGQQDNWLAFLQLWKPSDQIWVGGLFDTDKHWGTPKELAEKFPAAPPMDSDLTRVVIWPEWASLRKTVQVLGRKWLVVEADSGSKESQWASLGFIRARLGLTLRAVVDSTGKSLHGWFDAPSIPPMSLKLLSAFLVGLGADPQALEQGATRVPGAFRCADPRNPSKPHGGLQTIVWINPTQLSTL